jgi:hypothetical protein
MKYETPALTKVGKAEEVIRGQFDVGNDIDGFYFFTGFEFLSDDEADSAATRKTA